jgi:amino acid adenylation domain-containing protein
MDGCKDVYSRLNVTLQQLVEQVVSGNKDRVAVRFANQELTYQQLNDRADMLAQTILFTNPDAEWIGVSTTRNLAMIVGVLAILKAGKAYLPLDPAYPDLRLQQIIADSDLKTCLAAEADEPLFNRLGLRVIGSDQTPVYSPPQSVAYQTSTAYVLYTSGSTGKPKGVCMGHSPLINLLQWQEKHSKAGIDTRTLQLAPLSFDVSFQEIFTTLTTGGTLVLVDETLRLDLNALLQFIDEQAINRLFLPFVALQYLAEMAVNTQCFPAGLHEVMTAGEQLKITPQIAAFFSALPQCLLFNQYGPTECHVITQLILSGNPASWPPLPTIGYPIDNVSLLVVDENLSPLPDGQTGELCFGGACLAEGYLNNPVLTNEKFIELPSATGSPVRVYRTGDLGRVLPDGSIEFSGRRDDQVKIRGHRVELGEVEVVISQLPAVSQAVVVAHSGTDGQKQLVAYIVPVEWTPPQADFRTQLDQKLPDYMMPSIFVWLDELPKTSSGKVDKKRLPEPDRKRPELTVAYRKPRTEIEQALARIWCSMLQIDRVGLDDNFFELGGNSLLAQKTAAALKEHQHILPVIKLYQYPTIATLADYIQPPKGSGQGHSAQIATRNQPENEGHASPNADVAVIGMAGRFPGASSIDALWDLLKEGRETTRFFSDSDLDASIPASLKNDPLYVKARGVIDQVDQFDAHFFGLSPKVAQLMDPQQRVFLEIAWEALEQTGYLPQQYAGRVGVFAGCGNNTYYQHNIPGHKDLIDQVGAFQVMTLNEKDYIASRTAYQLNLKGPAVSVYSACSTSLLAISQAVQSIRSGQCEVALAGGASITTPVNSGHLYQEGAMLSQDGHCRSFDADARGTVFSDGAGVVLLKSRVAAERDGDTIYAVIKGVGVNNDGGGKGSFTAPSAEGQAGAIAMAIADAQVDPATISYVEAHGTATPLGDPIEIDGLIQAFGEQPEKQYCAIGSIKSNMGHLTQAAGVAGLIKATLALYHRQIPPSINFSTPNPAIDFTNSPFFVNTRLTDWQTEQPRRAGVSSFGVGGTNVHVVLEEFINPEYIASAGRPVQLVTWSAKSADSLDAYAQHLAGYAGEMPESNLADSAFTLQTTRAPFMHRQFVVVSTLTELQDKLSTEKGTSPALKTGSRPDEVAFLFPGQGAQYLNMGRGLYAHEAVFRQAVDACAEQLLPYMDIDIRRVMYPETVDSEAEQRLKNTRYTQPALFVTEYALAQLWMSWGIQPTLFCGHSIGEFVAAHLAGVFSLSDALTLIAARGRLVSEQPRGSMLSVRMAAERVATLMTPGLSMAAINSHTLCVVAGPDEHIADFARLLDEQGIPNQPLSTSHAFHSAMMDPIVSGFAEVVAGIKLNRPQKPVVSTVSGTWMTDAQATDPNYWAKHLRDTVRFSDALDTIFSLGHPLLLEVGPGRVMATLARQQAGKKPITVLAGMPDLPDWKADCQSVLNTLGLLYQNGIDPDWAGFYAGQQRKKVQVPTYAFSKKRCWLDPVRIDSVSQDQGTSSPSLPDREVNFNSVVTAHSLNSALGLNLNGAIMPDQNTPIVMRKDKLIHTVSQLLEEASGIEMDGVAPDTSFLEIGLDSLLLTQVALTLKKEFGVPITFRQLTSDYTSPEQLADYLDQILPAELQQPVQTPVHVQYVAPVTQPATTTINPTLDLIAQQMQLLAKQIELLQAGNVPTPIPTPPATVPATPVNGVLKSRSNGHTVSDTADLTPEETVELKKPFGATARIDRQASALSDTQQEFIRQLTERYNRKTAKSKAYAQQHRAQMADPRVVSGFRPYTKELVYPLVVNRSAGSHLWDIDGNEYIDALNGFGSNMFGYQPDWLKETLHAQIELGFEVGPQHELAGEVSQLICELTGADRAALCNTGSEAVLGAMRIARTVTGRSLIVAFSGSYHGIVDEVVVRGTKKLKSFPAAPGIMPESVQNMLILDYGTDESLQIIRERAHELAAVLVEPVQSRRPEFVPVDFLKQVRTVTEASGTVLIFDEVITGFRSHPGGTQALFGIKADLATYGKVVGAGLPIGVIAGKRAFMDALDGGFWQYGDASVPEVGVTYFAGTFVRHPLALAAASAALTYMKESGPQLQEDLTRKTTRLANELNAVLSQWKLPLVAVHFGSLWKIKFTEEVVYGELLFTLMRDKGIHIWDGFPCFLTEAHTHDEIDMIIFQFTESIQELIKTGFFGTEMSRDAKFPENGADFSRYVPAPDAKLGRDVDGNPAWFIPNPALPGKYLQVKLN